MEGTSGRTVELFVNHFEVQSVPTGGIHAYDVSSFLLDWLACVQTSNGY
jgi:hypothetical protein